MKSDIGKSLIILDEEISEHYGSGQDGEYRIADRYLEDVSYPEEAFVIHSNIHDDYTTLYCPEGFSEVFFKIGKDSTYD